MTNNAPYEVLNRKNEVLVELESESEAQTTQKRS